MAGRTSTEIQADYTAVHAAWLKALEAEQYNMADRGLRRSPSEKLYEQMMKLDAELRQASRGGIAVRFATPVTD